MSKKMERREFLLASTMAAAGLLIYTPKKALSSDGPGPAQTAKDPANMSLLEKKHVPVIEIPERVTKGVAFPVTVTVGEVIHPMVPEHHIEYIELMVNGKEAGKVLLQPVVNAPKVTFFITLEDSATLQVRELCNLHGLWENTKKVSLS